MRKLWPGEQQAQDEMYKLADQQYDLRKVINKLEDDWETLNEERRALLQKFPCLYLHSPKNRRERSQKC
jgi:cell division protein FtsB